jgi:hypothetical protein
MIKNKYLENSAGEKIYVEVYSPKKIEQTVFFCHGITGCRKGRTMEDDYFQKIAEKLMDNNCKVVLFDFSGHGESEGNDYDVTLSKSVSELELVFNNEIVDEDKVSFLAFSYGAAVLCEFLKENQNIKPKKIVMYSPCLYPLESCFLNNDSIFGKDIFEGYNNGELIKNGYVTVGAKNFKFGNKMIEECNDFYPNYLSNFSDRILVISGREDLILNTKYNEEFCMENNIENIYFDASHSLFEKIDEVSDITIEYLNK